VDNVRLEAIGQRGEACIIVMRRQTLANGQSVDVCALATGERLRPTDVSGEYTTLDGARTYRLRSQDEASRGSGAGH
jgi:hypothetical protein